MFDPTSREEIAIIQRLLPFLKPATTVTVAPGATDEDRYWRNLRARLGNNLLSLCLKGAELGTFPSLGHLAEQMETPESRCSRGVGTLADPSGKLTRLAGLASRSSCGMARRTCTAFRLPYEEPSCADPGRLLTTEFGRAPWRRIHGCAARTAECVKHATGHQSARNAPEADGHVCRAVSPLLELATSPARARTPAAPLPTAHRFRG